VTTDHFYVHLICWAYYPPCSCSASAHSDVRTRSAGSSSVAHVFLPEKEVIFWLKMTAPLCVEAAWLPGCWHVLTEDPMASISVTGPAFVDVL
jgi:hypothetical protein